MLSGGFFLGALRVFWGGCGVELAVGGTSRRALYELMNSNAFGESPSKFLRCSAAASLDKVEV